MSCVFFPGRFAAAATAAFATLLELRGPEPHLPEGYVPMLSTHPLKERLKGHFEIQFGNIGDVYYINHLDYIASTPIAFHSPT